MADEGRLGSRAQVVNLEAEKARRFLRELAGKPFVTLVLNGDQVTVYLKGCTQEDLVHMIGAIGELALEG